MSFEPTQPCRGCRQPIYVFDLHPKYHRCQPCVREMLAAYEQTYLERHPERVRATQLKHYRNYRPKRMILMAKRRAAKKGLAFDLDDHREQVIARIEAGHCELTGVPFRAPGATYGETWDSPSIDRRNPAEGYVYSNIRIICWALNAALGSWGEDKLIEMVAAMQARKQLRAA